jgi:site-specific DNA-methyltransferase (adenine-specific)
MTDNKRARNNRTTITTGEDLRRYEKLLVTPSELDIRRLDNITILGKLEEVAAKLPKNFVDLLFIDPPYNLNKDFGNNKFKTLTPKAYEAQFEQWLGSIMHTLKKSASVYVCCDWKSSPMIYNVLSRHLKIRNRITWERDKGRGALTNWKNCSEDVWFATVSDDYKFNIDAVKLKRKVLAPYKVEGVAKDWNEGEDGKFRLTHPSNLWTDITIPFWSMPENTDHPTQKPEKLVAKIILASSGKGDFVFDPFLGSGTTSVVAKKLGRKYLGIETNREYCILTEKRLESAEQNNTIQGYHDGVFWERNSLSEQKNANKRSN